MSERPNPIRVLLAAVVDAETPEERDKAWDEIEARFAAAYAREEELREALKFYARQRGLGAVLAGDAGAIARRALADQGASPGKGKP